MGTEWRGSGRAIERTCGDSCLAQPVACEFYSIYPRSVIGTHGFNNSAVREQQRCTVCYAIT
jgi:hypothetical protein